MNFRNAKLASGLLASVLVLSPMSTVLAANSATANSKSSPPQKVRFQQADLTTANGTAASATRVQEMQGTVNPLVSSGQAKRLQATDPNKSIRLGFVLKPRNVSGLESIVASGRTVTPQQYQSNFAPTSQAVQTVQKFLKQGNLQIVSQSSEYLLVQGTVAQVEKALQVTLNDYQSKDRHFYANANNPVLPTEVATEINGILGLDGQTFNSPSMKKNVTGQATGSITPDAIRSAYGLNSASLGGLDGSKQNIAILSEYGFNKQDVKQFSDTFGIPYNDQQIIHQFTEDNGQSSLVDDSSTLQVEWAHAIAPGATITEYETDYNDDGMVFEGLDEILNAKTPANVLEMNFTQPETAMFPSSLAAWHTKLLEAAARGVTVVVPSGDLGAYNGGYDVKDVTFPASDPYVLAVGGTSLTVDDANKRTTETGWGEADLNDWQDYITNGSGGGYSAVFPDSYSGTSQKRRVPDVSMPAQNIEMYSGQDGGWVAGSGTSYAAPMWSGLIALAAQKAKHGFGWIRPAINNIATSKTTSSVFRDITEGDNGGYSAAPGWDEVTGWGSPANATALVQALSTQKINQPSSHPAIIGMIAGNDIQDFAQVFFNGVDTVDIIGTGFGAKQGTVTLTDANGKSYPVPVVTWTDSDIQLDISEDPASLFQQANAPHKAGTYNLSVKLASGTTLNKLPVTLSDFLYMTSNWEDQTNVSGKDNPIYKDITVTAYGPDGNPDETGPTQTLTESLFFDHPNESMNQFDVSQNGQSVTGTQSGMFGANYSVQMVNGQANFQVASSTTSEIFSIIRGDNLLATTDPLYFTNQDEKPTHILATGDNEYDTPVYTSSVQGANGIDFILADAYGNPVISKDQIQISVSGATGNIKIGSLPYVNDSPPTQTVDSYTGQGAVGVQDDTPETIQVTLTDLTDPTVTPLQVPLTFVAATHIKITPDQETTSTPISTPGQDPNWQYLHVALLDANEQTVSCACDGSFFISDQYTNVVFPQELNVQVQVDGQWVPFDAVTNPYTLDFSDGAVALRVASTHPTQYMYMASANFAYSDDTENEIQDDYLYEFTAGSFAKLQAVAQLPHMATSSSANPQYVPVTLTTTDANDDIVSASDDTIAMTEAANGPDVTVALKDTDGNLQVLQPVNGVWTFGLSQLQNNQFYVTSEQPGQAVFTLTDTTNPDVQAANLQIDFINSTVKSLHAVTPTTTLAKTGTQTVELDLLDANGQKVVGSSDQIALTIRPNSRNLNVTDENGNALKSDNMGRYVVQADGGAGIFHVTDNAGERLSYSFADLSEPTLVNVSTQGTFSQVSRLAFSDKAIATTGSLQAGDSKSVTVTALDQYNHSMAGATVYLSMNLAADRGTAAVGGQQLTMQPQPFVTDDQGQVMITYTAPNHLPGIGTDTITVQDAQNNPRVKASLSYTYTPIASLAYSPTVIAKKGSLSAGGSAIVTLTAFDGKRHALANTVVYLSLKSVGGTAVVGETELTNTPQAFVTDANGQIQITYTTPSLLPKSGSESITAQVSSGKPTLMVTASYMF